MKDVITIAVGMEHVKQEMNVNAFLDLVVQIALWVYIIFDIIFIGACPYSEAYVDLPLGDLNHNGAVDEEPVKTEWYPQEGLRENPYENVKSRSHRYAECSNAGICNRDTGLCECFSGFVGSACQRRACPTSVANTMCSGHGVCMSSETYMILNDLDFKSGVAGSYSWEYDKFYTCVCDKGYIGISCNARQCPMGVDPVASAQPELHWDFILYDDEQPGSSFDHYYVLQYDGVVYKSAVVYKHTKLCYNDNKHETDLAAVSGLKEEIRRIITVIPPLAQVIVSAECTKEGKLSITLTPEYLDAKKMADSKLYVYKAETDGNPTTSSAIENDVNGSALSPMTVKPAPLKETISEALCSNRGNCNRDTGLCECYDGYSGASCQLTRNK